MYFSNFKVYSERKHSSKKRCKIYDNRRHLGKKAVSPCLAMDSFLFLEEVFLLPFFFLEYCVGLCSDGGIGPRTVGGRFP